MRAVTALLRMVCTRRSPYPREGVERYMQEARRKTLTISIAAYNMSAYIAQCLESCMSEEVMDALEVFIIDDGSTDDTAKIAKEFVDEYPGTFKLLSKKNGGYGSTVNLGMKAATGKYFRLLDADDWISKGSLSKLIPLLQEYDADLAITPMYRCVEGDEPRLIDTTFGFEARRDVPAGTLPPSSYMSMWRLTVRTALLREHPFELPEHCVFTDQLFVANCLAHARSMVFLDCPLYCYRIGRDGQSVAPESRIAHKRELEKVTLEEISLFEGTVEEDQRRAMLGTLAAHYGTYLKLLVMMPRSLAHYREIRTLEGRLRKSAPELYREAANRRKLTGVLRRSHYLAYWPLTLLDLKQSKYWEPN